MKVQCQDGIPPGTSDRFRGGHEFGCELNTMEGGSAIAAPVSNSTRGKLVRNTRRLEFYYAGGPQNGGAPRFSLFTDFCREETDLTATHTDTKSCGTGGHTDGTWDETLFIDVNGCNDGDVYVGAILLKSLPAEDSDPTCNVYETYGFDGFERTGDEHVHPNWADYVAVHPNDRFALNTGDLDGTAQDFKRLDNFIIADVPVHYLVYRVRMQGSNSAP